MTLGRCPLGIFCSRGTIPLDSHRFDKTEDCPSVRPICTRGYLIANRFACIVKAGGSVRSLGLGHSSKKQTQIEPRGNPPLGGRLPIPSIPPAM